MTLRDRLPQWFRPVFYLSHNVITIVGAVLTTSSAFTMLGFWIIDFATQGPINPYIGVIIFLILPGIFAFGLVLIPAGAFLRRYQLRTAGQLPSLYPNIDMRRPFFRQAAAWVAGLTILNAIILSVGSYRSVEYMDSAQFCGQTCHTVMQPEYTAYGVSAHQRVACVQCHIGPGAGWFVKSKLSGVRQVLAVPFIPTARRSRRRWRSCAPREKPASSVIGRRCLPGTSCWCEKNIPKTKKTRF